MAVFTIRVELHLAVAGDYQKLHLAMERSGFSRAIRSDDGRVYALPEAEYDYIGEVTDQQVLNLVIATAQTVGRTFSVLITRAQSRIWTNLQQR
jgi:hypothetical protein